MHINASSHCYRYKFINFSKEDDNSLKQSKEFVPSLELEEISVNGRAINLQVAYLYIKRPVQPTRYQDHNE